MNKGDDFLRERNPGALIKFAVYALCVAAMVIPTTRLMSEGPAGSGDIPVLTNLQQVRDLSVAEAARKYRVKVRAIVNYFDPVIGELFVQDKTNGVFVFARYSKLSGPLHAGQVIDIAGETTPGDFAPAITNGVVTVVGEAPLPVALRLPYEQYAAGQHECQRLEIEGLVQSGQVRQGRLQLNVRTIEGSLVASMTEFPADWTERFVRAKVRLRGVIAAIFNEHRQAVGVRMFIPGGQIEVVQAAPTDPFALPLSALAEVGQVHLKSELLQAIRVRGAVTGIEPRMGLFISDGTLSLEAQDANLCGAKTGDVVDIVGFPGMLEGRPALENSICRRVGDRRVVTPLEVTPQQVLPTPRVEDASGYSYSTDSRYDMRLVRMEGTVLQTSSGPDEETWMMRSGETLFTATLPTGKAREGAPMESGTRLRLTGVCIVTFDQFRRGESFRILLRMPADAVVLDRPPWWNQKHAAWIVAVVLVSFLAALLWITVLRRQVSQKTHELVRTNQMLRHLSEQDGLTGIANRRQFDTRLEVEFKRAIRAGAPLSLLMIDIDFFKKLNDEYGHPYGDECLIRVAAALSSAAMRTDDLVARFGGEEFAAILPWTDLQGALEVAEKMQSAIAALSIAHSESPFGGMLTICIGAACVDPTPLRQPGELIELADRALYRAKVEGRNRVRSMEAG